MPEDKLTAALDDIRSRHYPVPDPSHSHRCAVHAPQVCESDRHKWPCHTFILLGAVDAVLEEHRRDTIATDWCADCGFAFPCQTVRILSRALLGEEAGDGGS